MLWIFLKFWCRPQTVYLMQVINTGTRFLGHKVVSKDIWSFLIIRINLTWRFLSPWRKLSCEHLSFHMNNKNRNILEGSPPGFQTHYPTSHPLSSTSGRKINKSSNNVMNNLRQSRLVVHCKFFQPELSIFISYAVIPFSRRARLFVWRWRRIHRIQENQSQGFVCF